MKRHNLFDIDLENKTAFCTVCGKTGIYLPEPRKQKQARPICINRAREIWLDNKEKRKLARVDEQSRPNWQPRHKLSEIDTDKLRAICVVCGPTDIRKVGKGQYSRYDCLTKSRNYMRHYRRSHYVARSTNPHALSEIDEENQVAVCTKCGSVKIVIWRGKKKTNRRCINAGLSPTHGEEDLYIPADKRIYEKS